MRIQLFILMALGLIGGMVLAKDMSSTQEQKQLAALVKADEKALPAMIDQKSEASLWSWFTQYMPGLPSWFSQDAVWGYVSSVSSMPQSLWNFVELMPGMAAGSLNIVKEKLDETYAFARALNLPYASIITATLLSGLAMIKDKGLDIATTIAYMFQTAYTWLEERYQKMDKTQLVVLAASSALIALIAFGVATVFAPISVAPALSTAFVTQKSVNLFSGQLVQKVLSSITAPMVTGTAPAC